MKFGSLIGLALAATLAACTDQGGGLLNMDMLGTDSAAPASAPADYVITGGSDSTVLGVAAGGLTGSHVGALLSGDDKTAAGETAARAAQVQTGEKVTWTYAGAQSQTPSSGWASPSGAPFQDSGGRTCRFVHESATRGDQTTADTVKLCNGPTGWVSA